MAVQWAYHVPAQESLSTETFTPRIVPGESEQPDKGFVILPADDAEQAMLAWIVGDAKARSSEPELPPQYRERRIGINPRGRGSGAALPCRAGTPRP